MDDLVVGKTRNGKEIVVKPNGTGLFFIEMRGGGKKPEALHGLFTSQDTAKEQINRYLVTASYVYKRKARDKAKEESDAKKSSGTD